MQNEGEKLFVNALPRDPNQKFKSASNGWRHRKKPPGVLNGEETNRGILALGLKTRERIKGYNPRRPIQNADRCVKCQRSGEEWAEIFHSSVEFLHF